MIFKQIDDRHYKRIDHPFYGNQHVQLHRRTNVHKRTSTQNHKTTKQIKAFICLVIFFSILIWRGVTAVEAYFNPPIISPIPDSMMIKSDLIKPSKTAVPTPTAIPIHLTPKKSLIKQKTGNTLQQITPVEDSRINKLQVFLMKRNSPLQYYAKEIVELADYYAIDYTLVPSIAGKESSFGINIKPNSFNAWGVMTWINGKRYIRSFTSWDEGIKFETILLAKNYKLNANEAIGAKYCPKTECSQTWAQDVTEFSDAINQN